VEFWDKIYRDSPINGTQGCWRPTETKGRLKDWCLLGQRFQSASNDWTLSLISYELKIFEDIDAMKRISWFSWTRHHTAQNQFSWTRHHTTHSFLNRIADLPSPVCVRRLPLGLGAARTETGWWVIWGYEMNPTIPNELILGYTGIIGVHFKNNWGFISELGFKLGVIGLVTFNTGNLVLNQLLFKGVTGFFSRNTAQLVGVFTSYPSTVYTGVPCGMYMRILYLYIHRITYIYIYIHTIVIKYHTIIIISMYPCKYRCNLHLYVWCYMCMRENTI
jgi:hypothetical protein